LEVFILKTTKSTMIKSNTEKREVQFELLRILAMCGVLMNHVFNYGLHIYEDFRIDVSSPFGFILWSVLEVMKLIALPSVNCYVLITGYFLIEKTELRLKGIWKIWSTTWFYAVGIYLLAVLIGIRSFKWNELITHATPLLSNSFWFVTSYIILLLFAPLISICMQHLSKRQYQLLLLIYGIICFQPLLGQFVMDNNQILLFTYLFMIGGYIKLYADTLSGRKIFLSFLFILIIMYAYTLFKNILLSNSDYTIYAMAYHGLVLPLSVALFIAFKNLKIEYKFIRKIILLIAPCSFAVYIIHTQSIVDVWLWKNVTEWLYSIPVYMLPLACIIVTLSVFSIGVCIDYIRIRISHFNFYR